jgi:intracellular sulfur oxidation DsrE/DsrF family protein
MAHLFRRYIIQARLLPGAAVSESGVAEILRRQQQGWNYIQI